MDTTASQAREAGRPDWSRRAVAVLAALFIAVAGCDDEALMPPEPAAGDLFARYAAIGNSITAGFQSGGINDSTQMESYAVLLAEGMGTEFNVPLLNSPGCPPPLTSVFTGEVVGGPTAPPCSFRQRPIPPILNNASVPGAALADVLSYQDPAANPNELSTVLLGGRTQMESVREVEPTFVSAWIGNNEILGAALQGDASLATDPETFASRYQAIVEDLEGLDAEGGVLVGVASVQLIPHLSPGAAYFQLHQDGTLSAAVAALFGPEAQQAFDANFDVADTCAPEAAGGVGESTLVPFGYGFELVQQAIQGVPATLDCAADASVLSGQEIAQMAEFIQAYNATIQSAADELGWAYYDPNPAFAQAQSEGNIPLFPDPQASGSPFGPCFSQDGFHPSGAAHAAVARQLAEAIDAEYGTDITVDAPGASACLGGS
ncbi:MAG: SGNH/GDSL hydrolase family protein [Gemmatimonadota bacterium]